jgi:hypothetical protein
MRYEQKVWETFPSDSLVISTGNCQVNLRPHVALKFAQYPFSVDYATDELISKTIRQYVYSWPAMTIPDVSF